MAMLTLIAEPFPDWEAQVHAAAARDLAKAVAATAPRSCSARYLVARGSEKPAFDSPVIRVEHLPMRAAMLPYVWQSGTTARPLDGEFVHALTPMLPLRSRGEDDGSQTSVTIPHSLAWEAPALLGSAQARLFRAFTRRAVKLADVLLTPTHATARVLQRQYGEHLPVQVLPLAPPSEYLAGDDAAARREALALPERYALTTAMPGEFGRLEWLFDALRTDPSLPALVVLDGLDPRAPAKEHRDENGATEIAVPDELRDRVAVVRPASSPTSARSSRAPRCCCSPRPTRARATPCSARSAPAYPCCTPTRTPPPSWCSTPASPPRLPDRSPPSTADSSATPKHSPSSPCSPATGAAATAGAAPPGSCGRPTPTSETVSGIRAPDRVGSHGPARRVQSASAAAAPPRERA